MFSVCSPLMDQRRDLTFHWGTSAQSLLGYILRESNLESGQEGGGVVMMSLIKLPRLHKAPKGADLITTKEGEERGEEVDGWGAALGWWWEGKLTLSCLQDSLPGATSAQFI